MTGQTLEGQAIVVTGASRGIGLATARALLEAGARVYCVARGGPRLDSAVASLGYGARAVPCDLSDATEIDRAVSDIVDACKGPPQAVVQAAGVFPLAGFDKTKSDDFNAALQVNLLGPYRLAQPLIAGMRERRDGHLVTVGSIADRTAFAENVAYAASKFGARAVHEVLREELRGSGVRVSLVSPAQVDTNIWDAIDPDNRPGFTPRAKMLRPEAVADAVLFVLTQPAETNIDELRLSRS